jgi:hypothetical protein
LRQTCRFLRARSVLGSLRCVVMSSFAWLQDLTPECSVTQGKRLDADQLERAVDECGRTLVSPTDAWWSSVQVTAISGSASAFHVAAPVWTAEEGRSDLTVELRLQESIPGVFDTEVLDLHVL